MAKSNKGQRRIGKEKHLHLLKSMIDDSLAEDPRRKSWRTWRTLQRTWRILGKYEANTGNTQKHGEKTTEKYLPDENFTWLSKKTTRKQRERRRQQGLEMQRKRENSEEMRKEEISKKHKVIERGGRREKNGGFLQLFTKIEAPH